MADDVVNNEITQGQLGQINGSDVGVAWVAPDGSEARIMIAATGGGTRWELLCDVRPNDVVPLGAGLVRVAGINAPAGKKHGAVSFAPGGGTAASVPPDVVMVPPGGRLRVDGPSVTTATDLTAEAWSPDEANPSSVTVEWLPARFPRDRTPSVQISRRNVHVGDVLKVGGGEMTVAGIRGSSANHPAWLVLRLSSQ